MSSILEQIEKEISSLTTGVEKTNTGKITAIADGVAKVSGLSEVMYNEMIEFPGGLTGLALNLEEDEVGVIINNLRDKLSGVDRIIDDEGGRVRKIKESRDSVEN